MKRYRIAAFALLFAAPVCAADLVIPLPADIKIERRTVPYQCDTNAVKVGLPSDAFRVEYINGGGNSLAVVPREGKSLIFVNVLSGSGARYAAQQYIWWEAHGIVTVSSTPEKGSASCHPAPGR